jgi:FG-GAP repeat
MRRVLFVSSLALACTLTSATLGLPLAHADPLGVSRASARTGSARAGRVTTPAAKSDFNGDGVPDLAIGERFAMVGSDVQAGEVHVLLGSANGPVVAGNQVFDETDLDPSAQPADVQWFGSALATGDFDRDGFADLAISAPSDTAASINGAGKVFVMYGSATGLDSTGFQEFDKSTAGLPGDPETGDEFGFALTAADLNGDGFTDLAIGDPFGTVKGHDQAGDVYVLAGSSTGLKTTGVVYLREGAIPNGVGGSPSAAGQFGLALAAANYNGDSHRDLVIGAPHDKVGSITGAGAVYVVEGTGDGPDPAQGVQRITEDTPGVGTEAKQDESFGVGLLAANLGRGRRQDLVIAAENETVSGQSEAGAIWVLYGTSSGLTSQGSQFLTQSTPGFPGNPTGEVGLGLAMAAGNVGGTKANDLVLGLDGFMVSGKRAGALIVLFGGTNGVSTAGAGLITQNTSGVAGVPESNGEFGSAVAVRKYGKGAPADVAVGADERTVSGHGGAGGIYVLFGTGGGATGTGSTAITEATTGMPEPPTDFELFGAALA